MKKISLSAIVLVVLAFAVAAAHAQSNYPAKPIRMLTPFSAGGGKAT